MRSTVAVAGATVVVGSSAQLAACKGKKCLAGEVGKVRGALDARAHHLERHQRGEEHLLL